MLKEETGEELRIHTHIYIFIKNNRQGNELDFVSRLSTSHSYIPNQQSKNSLSQQIPPTRPQQTAHLHSEYSIQDFGGNVHEDRGEQNAIDDYMIVFG